jgi:DNA-binding Xre family transcriptional regulator
MVVFRIRQVAEDRGITTAYQLQKAMGINPGMAARLWKHSGQGITLRTIDALCEALNCKPCDLFDYKPGKKAK